ncbi:UNVERIFIED_CONTAM: hypothetical protein FKN15_039632 [Acipenser sinensis]
MTQPERHGREANTDAARPDSSPEGNRAPVETGEGRSRPPVGRWREPRQWSPQVMQDNIKDGGGKEGSSDAQRNLHSPNQDRHSTGQLSSEAGPRYPGSPIMGLNFPPLTTIIALSLADLSVVQSRSP